MKVVRFEVEVEDEILDTYNSSDEMWRNAKGKVFLLKNSFDYQILECQNEKTDDRKYADVAMYLLPKNATIVGENINDNNNEITDAIEDLGITLNENKTVLLEAIKKLEEKIDSAGNKGISEKTLLSALDIISKGR